MTVYSDDEYFVNNILYLFSEFGKGPFKSACGVIGCRALGNARNMEKTCHTTLEECPYESRNWANESDLINRVLVSPTVPIPVYTAQKPIELPTPTSPLVTEIKTEVASSDEDDDNANTDKFGLKVPEYDEIVVPVIDKVESINEMPYNEKETALRMRISKADLQDYLPGVDSYNIWLKNLKLLRSSHTPTVATDPNQWSIDEVVKYVHSVPKCENIANLFRQFEIDGEAFLCLTQEDMSSLMGLKYGKSVRIFSHIIQLREDCMMMQPNIENY